MPQASTDTAQHEIWLACVERLAQEMPEQQFNTWIRPLTARVADDLTRVTILVGNRFKMDWIRTQYSAKIATVLSELAENEVAIELALAPREGPTRSTPTLRTLQEQVLAEAPRCPRPKTPWPTA